MSAEPAAVPTPASGVRTSRIECNLDNDPRLLASVETIVAHAAKRAELPEETQQEVAVAAGEASRESATSSNGTGVATASTRLIVDEFSDRLEVTFDLPAGRNGDGIRKRLEQKASDRVRFDSPDGRVRITLVKPCGAAKSGSVR
jgi:hypothetical protein